MDPTPTPKQEAIARAYAHILDFARRHGSITNKQASSIGGFAQGYYHLRKLEQRGWLRRSDYNKWDWRAPRWTCPACGLMPASPTDCDCLT